MKQCKIEFRCSSKEKEIIIKNAAKVKLDISKFCRKSCVEGIKVIRNRNDTSKLENEINSLIYEINKVGVNVNQIAYVLNANDNFNSKDIAQEFNHLVKTFSIIEIKINNIEENIERVYSEWQ